MCRAGPGRCRDGRSGQRPSGLESGAPGLDQTNRPLAEREAARLLAAFPAPPHAKRLDALPNGVTLERGITPGAEALVIKTQFWTVPSVGPDVIHNLGTTVPAGAGVGPSTTLGGGDSVTDYGFDWPPSATLVERQLLIEARPYGRQVLIRLDAIVEYRPHRPATAVIPVAATALVTTMTPRLPSSDVHILPYGPAFTTDPARIARVAALIDSAEMEPQGEMRHCPAMTGGEMDLTFRAGTAGPTVASVRIGLSGCSSIGLTVRGVTAELVGGTDQVNEIISILGLSWPEQ